MPVLIAALVLVCINAVIRTNEVIAELEEQKSGIAAEKNSRYISVLIPVGLLINSGIPHDRWISSAVYQLSAAYFRDHYDGSRSRADDAEEKLVGNRRLPFLVRMEEQCIEKREFSSKQSGNETDQKCCDDRSLSDAVQAVCED